MNKKSKTADAVFGVGGVGANTETAIPSQKPSRKPRQKSTYRLEQKFGAGTAEGWSSVEGSPVFDDTAAAVQWAEENAVGDVSADLRVVAIKAEFSVTTETMRKTVVKMK